MNGIDTRMERFGVLPSIQQRQEELLADLHALKVTRRIERAQREARRKEAPAPNLVLARDFQAINPLDNWLDVTDRNGSAFDIPYLQQIGRIRAVEINGRTYAQEATA